MATLGALKETLRQTAGASGLSHSQGLTDAQYDAGFKSLVQDLGQVAYQEFVAPQLTRLLVSLLRSRVCVSVLEIGPGPVSVLESLPGYVRQRIGGYAVYEPNDLFASRLQERLSNASSPGNPLPGLEGSPDIRRTQFSSDTHEDAATCPEKFDIVLFCHSMYGMKPKRNFIERALKLLVERPEGGLVVVFHRESALHLDGLTCHRTAAFPTGVACVANDDETLDCSAQFVAGFAVPNDLAGDAIRAEWRRVCRTSGRGEEAHPGQLLFSAPDIMVAFSHEATSLPELLVQVPTQAGEKKIKSWEARLHCPASVIRPSNVHDVQQCVRWALKHGTSLTVIGGSHGGHCIMPSVVAVDMRGLNQIDIIRAKHEEATPGSASDALVVAEAGCKSGDIIRKTLAEGLTVPLGSRPSVGAGLWLQGGIGHLARQHGLTCDAIVGAVMVSVATGEVLVVGHVPAQHRPEGALHAENDADLLWGLRGAGSSLGFVVSVVFQAYRASAYSIQKWVVPLDSRDHIRRRLDEFDDLVVRRLPRHCSADAYLYWDDGKSHLGISVFKSATNAAVLEPLPDLETILGHPCETQTTDGLGLFEAEMYMSSMHGGHGGKTSAFKRCVFLKGIGAANVADLLATAVEQRPSPRCYLHLLHGGGAVGDIAADATAFGCRDWDFACVITGVWSREESVAEITASAEAAMKWVYNVVRDLLPFSAGVYGADLGPDPRDAALAKKAFGPNLSRLARLKQRCDPHGVLAYACPLPRAPTQQRLIVIVSGDSCAGKDFCGEVWAACVNRHAQGSLRAQAVSISVATKREYAAATGADVERLLGDRAYKEEHRPTLTAFFQNQLRLRPRLLEEHFLEVVCKARDVSVLFVTGMRDEAPVAALSHLVPDSRLLEVRVNASSKTLQDRRGGEGVDHDDEEDTDGKDEDNCPGLDFNNDTAGTEAAVVFCERHLLPFFQEDLQRLADMVLPVPNFPRRGIDFRDVLGISQQSGGLALCTSLLQTHFTGDWAQVSIIACCETGGFIFAPGLAARFNVPLALIREASKLPPPTISVSKSASYISSAATNGSQEQRLAIGRDTVYKGAAVVVVDDVLATGNTLCAVLHLLCDAGVSIKDIDVMVVAEFPVHCGRQLLHRRGYGGVKVQSLLVFDGE